MALHNQTNMERLPQHVAIIMDGNGRWAQSRGRVRSFGHQNGIKSVRDSVESCRELGIKYLTLYCFSTENRKRPREEVEGLMRLMVKTLRKDKEKLFENNIRLNAIGAIDSLAPKVLQTLREVVQYTQSRENVLTLALNYGSQQEIIRAIRNIAKKVKNATLQADEIDVQLLEDHLYTQGLPAVDLLIRTGEEQRISNFLLWQIAYAELYLSKVLWPDWRKKHFYKAIVSYQKRKRRFGRTSEQVSNSDFL